MNTQRQVLQAKDPDAELKYRWTAYTQISPHIKRALIASEDAKFLAHEGFDWEGIQTAWEKNLKKGKIVAGGSTISQQLAKNLFLSSKKTPWRKLEEATITVMMEKMMTKRRIFEIYLNVIEWGNGIFGIEAASQHYYKKSARYLTSVEAAKLAAMVPNPRYYDTHRYDKKLLRKARIIQRRMYYAEYP
jgi:monofunctional biosynthetic peptidoglycan transglycosylase